MPHLLKALGLACLADEGQGLLNRVEPYRGGKSLRSLNAMVPIPPIEPDMRHVGKGAHPVTHRFEAVGQVGSAGGLQAQAQRPGHGARRNRAQQVAALPQALDLGAKVCRQGPAHGAVPSPAVFASTNPCAFCVRYSSIDRQRSRESRPPSLCTKPTLATKGSMM